MPRLTRRPKLELTIDDLARESGMTARNIRAHQSRGLLPPPEVRGRTGYYGPDHLARLELIKEMQADGFGLEAIRKLLDRAGDSKAMLDFTRALREPFAEEGGQIMSLDELAKPWSDAEPRALQRLLDKSIQLGLIRPVGDDRFEVVSPRMMKAREELADLGISPDAAIEVAATLRRHADGVARAFVKIFIEEVWKPFEQAGRPKKQWPQVREALERLRPIASEALLGIFGIAMRDAVERAFGEEMARLEEKGKG